MLYDNALLARAYLHGWQVSGDPILRRTAEETLDWALREITAEGALYSALDADSEGVEGKFYVWSLDELHDVLGDDAGAALPWFGASVRGNFEGENIPCARAEPPPAVRARIRAALLAARAERVRPGLDDKRLTSWNALMISALADAGAALDATLPRGGPPRRRLRARGDARRRWPSAAHVQRRRGEAQRLSRGSRVLLEALVALYEATFEARWFQAALETADAIFDRFSDPEHGGFFQTSSDHERLVARRKELEDGPIPSGASSAAFGLLRLAALTGEARYEAHSTPRVGLLPWLARRYPRVFGHFLQALDFERQSVREVALVGPDLAPLARVVRGRFRPHLVLAGDEGGGVPLLEGRTPVDGRSAAYVCEGFACKQPVCEPDELEALLTPIGP